MSLWYSRFQNESQLQSASHNSPPLKWGARGSGVKEFQRALVDLGYAMPGSTKTSGELDGIFGEETYGIVKKFQGDHGTFAKLKFGLTLGIDGVAGKDTLFILDDIMRLAEEERPNPNGPLPDPPAKSKPDPFAKLDYAGKLGRSIDLCMDDLPDAVKDTAKDMLQPEALAILAGVLAAWGVAHFFGVGEIADIVMLATGALFMGLTAIDAGKELYAFATEVDQAKNDVELRAAGQHFVKFVAMVGIEVVCALITKGAGKAIKIKLPKPPPRKFPPAKLWYKPRLTRTPKLKAGQGSTSHYGDVKVSTNGSPEDQALALYHEMIHSYLAPRLAVFQELRASLAAKGYNDSYFLRYLEEALAETYAQVRVNGVSGVPTGLEFPLGKAYNITVVDLSSELAKYAAGYFVGTITVAGVSYGVYELSSSVNP